MLAVAPTLSAMEVLQKVGFADAITIELLLQDKRNADDIRGKVVNVDEASAMVSALARWQSCSGWQRSDPYESYSAAIPNRSKSVEAGDALRILEEGISASRP